MVDDNPDVFGAIAVADTAHDEARRILAQYRDHCLSYVDAVIFHVVDVTPSVSRILTVDGADFRSYRFAHRVDVVTPG